MRRIPLATVARDLVGLLGLTMITTSGLIVATGSPAPADGRALTVTPASDLENQVVQVAWSGFTPTSGSGDNAVIILQCKANPASLADCFTG